MRCLLIGALLNMFIWQPQGLRESDIVGYWLNDTRDMVVKIYQKEDHSFAGDVVWLSDSLDAYNQPLRDVMNDDPRKRSRLVMGLTILYDFKWSSDAWRYGTYYNFKTGNDYGIKISLDDEGNLRLTGYYGILFFLGKTKVWTPVPDKSLYGLN
ncbi:MAG TPA: DUF2147 domain-containing protein [Chitinophagales bacterium]|nr:DUF2147 domain-containing protein [Chitinophagales bacterium]